MNRLPIGSIIEADACTALRTLPPASVDTVVTSPPYMGLRNYFHPDQLGNEASVEQWVGNLRAVMAEVTRVLKPTGTVWLNVGDSYSAHPRFGALPKSRVLALERLALALLEDGWLIRNHLAWIKPNPTPSSTRDRLTCAWESIYLLTRSPHYYFDLDAIRVPHTSQRPPQRKPLVPKGKAPWSGPLAGDQGGLDRLHAAGLPGHPLGKNPTDVWSIPTSHYRSRHHAAFPEALVARPLRAGCPERVCVRCGCPWRRQPVERRVGRLAVLGSLRPSCPCGAAWRPGVVLDPFMGSGTTAVVAERLGRDWVGIELNADFVSLSRDRLKRARADDVPNLRQSGTDAGQPAA
jgi:site-specific DNA-methyltransferase (adenine-specific)